MNLFQKRAENVGIMALLPAKSGPNGMFEAQITCCVDIWRDTYSQKFSITDGEHLVSPAFECVGCTGTWMPESMAIIYTYPISPCSCIPQLTCRQVCHRGLFVRSDTLSIQELLGVCNSDLHSAQGREL